jgi:hypothetical protein
VSSSRSRVARFAGVGALAIALPLAVAGTAFACNWSGGSQPPGATGCDSLTQTDFEFTVSDGTSSSQWAPAAVDPGLNNDGKFAISTARVRVKAGVDLGSCSLPVSLASYSTHGSTWQSSGTQTLYSWTHATISASTPQVTLTVQTPTASCFQQEDLYFGNARYTGQTAPSYPNGVYPPTDLLIAGYNGGTTGGSTCSSTPPVTTPPVTPTPTGPVPSVSATATGPGVLGSGTPAATPTAAKLAHTGGGDTMLYAGGAAALLALGGAGVFGTRKFAAKRTH